MILNHPDEYKEGYRILMRCKRNKDGEGSTGGDRKSVKVITRSVEEFDAALKKLAGEMAPNERIYTTLDARDIESGIREFKFKLLESDYYGDVERHGFYVDSFNRFVSSLQSHGSRHTKLFLFDCDSIEEGMACMAALDAAGLHKNIKHSYSTKNGKHIICEPFNPKLIPEEFQRIIHRNAMMLWAF